MISLIPIKTRILKEGDDLFQVLVKQLEEEKIKIVDGDVFVLSSKVVSLLEGGRVPLSSFDKPTELSNFLSQKTGISSQMAQAVIGEADEIVGWVPQGVTTLKQGIIECNSGIDCSNADEGRCILLPKDSEKSAIKLYLQIKERFNVRTGIIVCDSVVRPLRRGTTGVALGVAGMRAYENDIGKEDLFGRKLTMTQRALADDLSCAAQLVMGEGAQCVPIVLIRNSGITLLDESEKNLGTTSETLFPAEDCLFFRNSVMFNPNTLAEIAKHKK